MAASAVEPPPLAVAAFASVNARTGTEDLVVVIETRRRPAGDTARAVRGRLVRELGVRAEYVHLVGAGELPRTTSGKVRRSACAARFGGAG